MAMIVHSPRPLLRLQAIPLLAAPDFHRLRLQLSLMVMGSSAFVIVFLRTLLGSAEIVMSGMKAAQLAVLFLDLPIITTKSKSFKAFRDT